MSSVRITMTLPIKGRDGFGRWVNIPGTVGDVCLEWHPEWIVEPATPADWPPQVADIWEAGGDEYAIARATGADPLLAVPLDTEDDAIGLDEFRALDPILVRRR